MRQQFLALNSKSQGPTPDVLRQCLLCVACLFSARSELSQKCETLVLSLELMRYRVDGEACKAKPQSINLVSGKLVRSEIISAMLKYIQKKKEKKGKRLGGGVGGRLYVPK